MENLSKLTNEGCLTADGIFFDSEEGLVRNAKSATIKTDKYLDGKISAITNAGNIYSESLFLHMNSLKNHNKIVANNKIIFIGDTFENRGEILANNDVLFIANILKNYANLRLNYAKIKEIRNDGNLQLFYSSKIGTLTNDGHIEFMGGNHNISKYISQKGSETLVRKSEAKTPAKKVTVVSPLEIRIQTIKPKNALILLSALNTFVFIDSLRLGGKIQASKVRVPRWSSFYQNQQRFIVEEMEIYFRYGEFTNDSNIIMPKTKLIFDMEDDNFTNSGKIICRALSVKNTDQFKNTGHIEAIEDIDIEATGKIENCSEPIIETKSVDDVEHDNLCTNIIRAWGPRGDRHRVIMYGDYDLNGSEIQAWTDTSFYINVISHTASIFPFYKVGKGLIKSNSGRVKLISDGAILNQYSTIIATKGFTLKSSQDSITNMLGDI